MKFPILYLFSLVTVIWISSVPFGGSVKLKWDPSPSEDIVGYYLYRSEKPGEGYVKPIDEPTDATSYTDLTHR